MRGSFYALVENQKQCAECVKLCKKCYIIGKRCLVERLMILSLLQKLHYWSYSFLHAGWTNICFKNVVHCKIEFVNSLRTNKIFN